ncbi:MAG: hypothetical protein CMJ78_24080 [Planctomycetaceae bacterium]|nr:hypothetical protein [Planctomycetaceae bacterium]
MAEPLRFHPLVADDLAAATAWYDEISIELGNRFRHTVDARFDSIEQWPESYGIADAPLRVARVDRFPYLIVFEHSPAATEVVGVFHSAANPNKWRARKQ